MCARSGTGGPQIIGRRGSTSKIASDASSLCAVGVFVLVELR